MAGTTGEGERGRRRDRETERERSRRQMVALNSVLPKTTHKDFACDGLTDSLRGTTGERRWRRGSEEERESGKG